MPANQLINEAANSSLLGLWPSSLWPEAVVPLACGRRQLGPKMVLDGGEDDHDDDGLDGWLVSWLVVWLLGCSVAWLCVCLVG